MPTSSSSQMKMNLSECAEKLEQEYAKDFGEVVGREPSTLELNLLNGIARCDSMADFLFEKLSIKANDKLMQQYLSLVCRG